MSGKLAMLPGMVRENPQRPLQESYIEETEISLKTRFLEHRHPTSTSSEDSRFLYIESPGHHLDLDQVKKNLRSGVEVFREKCERGHLHLSQAIT